MEFANWYSDTLDPKRKASFQDLRIDPSRTTNTKVFTPVPEKYYKTFYFDGSKISHPVARALRSRGFRKVDDTDHAHLIYTYSNHADWATELLPWQRFNYIPDLEKWNRKAQFTYWYKDYEESTGKPPSVYVPESYMMTETKQEIEAFRTVLEQQNGKNHPWVHKLSSVNQGKGITILPPNSKRLLGLPDKSLKDLKRKPSGSASEDEDNPASIVQRYICNEMTWDGRKFDVRMYWFVASLDPLIVLYHDGYVRVGNSAYSETSFRDTTSHLTSHTGLGAETKATFWQFGEVLEEQHRANTERHKKSQRYPGGSTPVEHVRNQFKHALGEMIEIFKDESFALPDYRKKHPKLSAENAFNFFCADFILDRDLDVWFIEPQVRRCVLCAMSLFLALFRSRECCICLLSCCCCFTNDALRKLIFVLSFAFCRTGVDWTRTITSVSRCTPPSSMGWSTSSRRSVASRNKTRTSSHWKNLETGRLFTPTDRSTTTTDTNDPRTKKDARCKRSETNTTKRSKPRKSFSR
jgi:hypothetical protein